MPDNNNKGDDPGSKENAGRQTKCDCPLCSLRDFWNQQSDSEAWRHFSKAQEEFLLGVKAVIDSRLEKLKATPPKKEPRVTKLKVD